MHLTQNGKSRVKFFLELTALNIHPGWVHIVLSLLDGWDLCTLLEISKVGLGSSWILCYRSMPPARCMDLMHVDLKGHKDEVVVIRSLPYEIAFAAVIVIDFLHGKDTAPPSCVERHGPQVI